MHVMVIIPIIIIIYAVTDICIEDIISEISVIIPTVSSETFFHL